MHQIAQIEFENCNFFQLLGGTSPQKLLLRGNFSLDTPFLMAKDSLKKA